ncbi:MAG: OmpA family protein [Immundisolibacteraceae bacterium]|nr:OmpA family protein [Immundisolibacteraceae bacterium]
MIKRIQAGLGLLLLYPLTNLAQYPGLTGEPWQVKTGMEKCSMSRQLNQGKAVASFNHETGKRLSFTIEHHPFISIASAVKVYASPSLWRHDQPLVPLGESLRKRGNQPFKISADVAEKMLHYLSQGQGTLFSYQDPSLTKRHKQPQLTLSPAFLQPGLAEFQACVQALKPFDPKLLDRIEIRFNYGSAALSPKALLTLTDLMTRLKKEYNLAGLKISGYTDAGGHNHQNSEMARMRVLSVENHLIAAGIPVELLTSHYLDQGKPRYSNNTAAGRAGNRRVDIQIIR